MTLEGYLITKNETNYLIQDEDFDADYANELEANALTWSYHDVYVLDKIPFTFTKFQSGQKINVWHNGTILESNPAKINVLKMEKMN
ncbi:Protein of unknown function [Oceanobacillus limi]|uniref:Uncharacterized protein n=2 Tax=Oceanobacillus limi TaxID=930131 RepID=A0A1I0FN48_9BACI|nr:Protein of unknown function [Oceanobacillus limi]